MGFVRNLSFLFRPELKNYHFKILTDKLCAIFTKEAPETYFIPPKTESKNQTIARGKFVDKYRNWRTAQKELGLIESKNFEVQGGEEKNCARKKDFIYLKLKFNSN